MCHVSARNERGAMQTPDGIRNTLKAKLCHHTSNPSDQTYDQLAVELGISKGALWKFVNTDYVPDDLGIRTRLGIEEPELIKQYRNDLGRFS